MSGRTCFCCFCNENSCFESVENTHLYNYPPYFSISSLVLSDNNIHSSKHCQKEGGALDTVNFHVLPYTE